MCGVFGFVATGAKGPDLSRLQTIARVTERRGRHAFGFAWIDSRGRLCSFKQTGRISDHLPLLAMAQDARLLIGHCRYATDGAPSENINNHPHPADGGWIVHNGVIREYRELLAEHDLPNVSQCDSEVLGLLIERLEGSLVDRCLRATDVAQDSPLVMLGLWKSPRKLLAIRRGNPLQIGQTQRGYYLGSLREGLPQVTAEVRDDTALEFSTRGGVTRVRSFDVTGAAIK